MASINFDVGRTQFIFEGTSSIDLAPYDSLIYSVRRLNIDGEFPGVPAGEIWGAYWPGSNNLNRFFTFDPGRKYEVNARVPFTLEY